ncbi:MAG: M20/M25/M40 family metallo-hydrolase [Acidobacteriota bacterium]|nr:M20/M25/M40 family metallo-hydrolase [Acidobacteriota bacterium]MDQ3419903.1 M20/M25/M40 family metallo-hydrolase [Acidobacteriota bacterium]
MKNTLIAVIAGLTVASAPAFTSLQIDTEINAKIRAEAENNSQIMRTMHFLTDVHGPRLTGSPNFKAAAEWTVKQMTEWGFTNGKLEPWDFVNADGTPRPGWLNERFAAHIISPVKDSLVGEVLAWTPSTKGTVTTEAVHVVAPTRPTQAELDAWIKDMTPKVKGKIVFVGPHTKVAVNINPPALRRDDEQLRQQLDPNAAPGDGRGGRGRGAGAGRGNAEPPDPTRLSPAVVNTAVNAMMMSAAVRVNDAGRDHGQIRAFQNSTYDVTKAPPTVVLRNEDYGRITRILANGTPVRLEFNIVNQTYPAEKSYNAVAEIRGTDKADEVVMLGGHLDSWHAATGATDNAIGCAVMMEAARILQAIGVKPRRTIRVALWGGEEQGLLGSKAYVKEHFGTAENPKPEFHKFNGYFNVDSGTGRIRSASVFGPPEAATVLREIFAPFVDFGMLGVTATDGRRAGGTDSTSFNHAGLPGIGLSQDPIEYNTYTWHTNLDTYERIIEDDVKKTAAAIASAVYHLAMRDEMLPRFSKENMPAPPAPPAQGRGGR